MAAMPKDQTGEEIPVFEGDEEKHRLHDAKQANDRARLVQSTEHRFPNKNQKAGRAGNAANLGQ